MSAYLLICLDGWPHGLTAYHIEKGLIKGTETVAQPLQKKNVASQLYAAFQCKRRLPMRVLWPAHRTQFAHKAWPLPAKEKERREILDNYLTHRHPDRLGLPLQVDIVEEEQGRFWQLAWPEPVSYQACMACLGGRQARIDVYFGAHRIDTEALFEDTLYDLDPVEGRIVGVRRASRLIVWQKDMDFSEEEARESYEVLTRHLGSLPSGPGDLPPDVAVDVLAEALPKQKPVGGQRRKTPLGLSNRQQTLAVGLGLGMVLPVVLLAGLYLWGEAGQSLELDGGTREGIETTVTPQTVSHRHQDLFHLLASDQEDGISYSERAADGYGATIRGHAQTMEDLIGLLARLEAQAAYGSVTLIEMQADQEGPGVSFVIQAGPKGGRP